MFAGAVLRRVKLMRPLRTSAIFDAVFKWIPLLGNKTTTAVLTGAVLGALLLQVNLLSGELELQKQHFETAVGKMANSLNDRVRLHVRRKSMGVLRRSAQSADSTLTITTPSGSTTLRWSAGGLMDPNTQGLDTSFFGGFLDNFQSTLPWPSQMGSEELDSIIESQLHINGVHAKPEWALVENGYFTQLGTEDFVAKNATFNYVLAESFFGPTRQLLIYFPRERFYLAMRVYLSLFAALLFSAVILSAFFGVQRERNRQKRLAEVKSDFINNMSHEFKTPLATINLAVDALLRNHDKMTPDRLRDYLGIIKSENKRMNAQMESVLQMSMLDKEEFTVNRVSMDLSDILLQAVDHFKLAVEERNGWIDSSIAQANYAYQGDPTHLKSAFTNLLDNAIKYSDEAPEISVALRSEPSQFVVVVRDRGIGMEESVQHQVFDRFFRATKGNIHDVKGHGLGLSFVKEIIEKHNGQIAVTSALGKGSEFTISLPK